jgi:hypothetical protein
MEKDQIGRLRWLAKKTNLWVNMTGNGPAVAAILDSFGIEYFKITVLGGERPLCEDYEQLTLRLGRTSTDEFLSLSETHR